MSARMPMKLEICANSLRSAVAAANAGAHRIELCQCLENGGITPSYGMIKQVLASVRIPVHVLLRPRAGGFVYSTEELDVIETDVQSCRDLGCAGVVLGVLDQQGRVNIEQCERFVRAAKPMDVTFHRAFDDCVDQTQALEDLIDAGFCRILTSGGRDSAETGSQRIAELVQQSRGRIVIMPGAGIDQENIQQIAKVTGASDFHASAKRTITDAHASSRFAATYFETEESLVKALIRALNADTAK